MRQMISFEDEWVKQAREKTKRGLVSVTFYQLRR